jgi:MoaA/NifB/PqqE/SkfB family radical SAM enzyme
MVKISEVVDRWIPAVCDVSVTNACNATCDFCSYAYNKGIVRDRRWIDPAEFARALPVLRRRGIRYLNFQGGEPLLHRGIDQLIADAANAGMRPALITNGWLLPQKMRRVAGAGLGTLLVSIDSHSMKDHERNRGLRGLKKRIQSGLVVAREHGIPTIASITMSRLVDYESLPEVLSDLGFDFATFSYPRRRPLGSSSLVYSKDSALVDLDSEELQIGFESIKRLKKRFPILNPFDSLSDMQRHVRGDVETFGCIGGRKYFYLDWNLDIWRCEAWNESMGSVFDLDRLQNYHDRCTKCMMSCYRDTSVLMHAGMAVVDAAAMAADGHVRAAAQTLFTKSVALSLRSAWATKRQIRRLSRIPVRQKPGAKLCEARVGFDNWSLPTRENKSDNRHLEREHDVEESNAASCQAKAHKSNRRTHRVSEL